MSRMAQVVVLARYEDKVMEPLTRPDEARTWHGCFARIPWFVEGWHIEFERRNGRRGVLKDLESLPWNEPACVQVMLHDEDDAGDPVQNRALRMLKSPLPVLLGSARG